MERRWILAEATRLLPNSGIEIYIVGGTQMMLIPLKISMEILSIYILWVGRIIQIPLWLRAADILVIPTSAEEKNWRCLYIANEVV